MLIKRTIQHLKITIRMYPRDNIHVSLLNINKILYVLSYSLTNIYSYVIFYNLGY